jgi:hypothetical protein
MAVKLKIAGEREAADRAAARGAVTGAEVAAPVTDLFAEVKVVQSFNLSASARARAPAPAEVEVEDDDILEIEVEGGFKIWTSARRYSEEVLCSSRGPRRG